MSGTRSRSARRKIDVRLQPLEKSILSEVEERRIAPEQHDRVVRVVHVDLGQALRQVLPRCHGVDHA